VRLPQKLPQPRRLRRSFRGREGPHPATWASMKGIEACLALRFFCALRRVVSAPRRRSLVFLFEVCRTAGTRVESRNRCRKIQQPNDWNHVLTIASQFAFVCASICASARIFICICMCFVFVIICVFIFVFVCVFMLVVVCVFVLVCFLTKDAATQFPSNRLPRLIRLYKTQDISKELRIIGSMSSSPRAWHIVELVRFTLRTTLTHSLSVCVSLSLSLSIYICMLVYMKMRTAC
jgi:hypothetical protein